MPETIDDIDSYIKNIYYIRVFQYQKQISVGIDLISGIRMAPVICEYHRYSLIGLFKHILYTGI